MAVNDGSRAQVAKHEKGSAASSAYNRISRDLGLLRSGLRNQTTERIDSMVAAVREKPVGEAISRSSSAMEDSDEEETMGFASLGIRSRSSGFRAAQPSTKAAAGHGPPLAKQRCLRGAQFDVESEVASVDGELREKADSDSELPEQLPPNKYNRKDGKLEGGSAKGAPAIAKVRGIFEAQKAAFSDAMLWDPKTKNRAVAKMASQLETAVEKLLSASPSGDVTAKELVDNIVQFIEQGKNKFAFFLKLRKNGLEWLAAPLSQADQDILQDVAPSVLATIFAYYVKELLKKLDQANGVILLALHFA